MKKMRAFAIRNCKELLRDPLNLLFGVGFPVVLLLMITLMARGIEEMPEIFSISAFAPAMAVFGLSFISLFLGNLIANDRRSAYLDRLRASPLTGADYVAGYALPLLPTALLQSAVCFGVAACFGFRLDADTLLALFVLLPVAALFISFGLLLGCLFSPAQVSGVGTVLVNAAAWLSGTWFPMEMMGEGFRTVCGLLPFAHAVGAVQAAAAGDYAAILPELLWVLGYAAVLFAAAAFAFRKKTSA